MSFALRSLVLAALCLPAMPLYGDAPASPTPLEVLQTANERIHRFTMDNGMVGIIKPDHSAPVASLQIWVGTGSIHEGPYLGAGLSHYVEHMIFKGTPTRTPGDITRQIDDAGGRINAYTSFDRTVFYVTMPSARWTTGLDVLSDAVQNASFPEAEWEREQQVIVREMAMGKDDPGRVLSKLLWETAYRVHPYKHPVIGYEDVFLSTTREDLQDFFHAHYTPDNMTVVLVGDVDVQAAERLIREAFTGFKRRMRPPVVIPAEPAQLTARFARKTGAYEVARLAQAWHTVSISDPDAAALDVLAAIVGQGDSSRLTLAIRDRMQLVHSISAWSYTPGYPGLFGIDATFEPEKEADVLKAISDQVTSWAITPFPEEELSKARRMVLVGALSEAQTMEGQAGGIGSGEYYAGDPRYNERYIERVEHVTAEQLQRIAAQYLTPSLQTVVLLTPETAVSAEQEKEAPALVKPPVRIALDNGIPLIVRGDHRLPLAHISVAFLGGLLSEDEQHAGITQFMADLLTRGTSARTATEIAHAVDDRGASLSSFAGQNSFGLQVTCLSTDVPFFIELMAECLNDSQFPEDEIAQQRSRQLAGVRAQRERPLFLAEEIVRDALYPHHPYRWTPIGTEQGVKAITREDLQAYLNKHRVTGNMAISVFGNVEPDEVRPWVQTAFASVPAGTAVRAEHNLTTAELPVRVKKRAPREQTIYLMAFPGVDLKDPDLQALSLLQSSLSGLSSELGIEVRDKRGLVYYVGALQRIGLEPGLFSLYAGTYESAVPEVEALMEAEIERITTNGIAADELARAQEQAVGAHYSALQNNAGLAQVSALNELYGLGFDYAFSAEQRIRAVTGEDVRKAAARLFDLNRRVISVIYPETNNDAQEKIEP